MAAFSLVSQHMLGAVYKRVSSRSSYACFNCSGVKRMAKRSDKGAKDAMFTPDCSGYGGIFRRDVACNISTIPIASVVVFPLSIPNAAIGMKSGESPLSEGGSVPSPIYSNKKPKQNAWVLSLSYILFFE